MVDCRSGEQNKCAQLYSGCRDWKLADIKELAPLRFLVKTARLPELLEQAFFQAV